MPGRSPFRGPGAGRPPFARQDIHDERDVPALPVPDALGEGEELVAGRRPVEEAFAAGRPAVRLLVVPNRREALEKLVLHATRLRIPIVELEGGSLTALSGFDGHQGVALVVEPRQFASLDDVLARAVERGEPPFVLALDSLEDPQNLGTLLRSAEAAGVHGVLFPTRRQAPLTPAAVKASAGAVEHLLLCPVNDLAGALADLHVRGLRVAGSEADAALTARQADLRGPLVLVVGSEGQGLGPTVRRRCDLLVRIPMRGAVGSLNAAVAGSILLFEAVAQRDPDGRQPAATSAAAAVAPAALAPPVEDRIEQEADGDVAPPEPDVPKTQRRSNRTKATTAGPPEAAEAQAAPPKPPRKRRRTGAAADTSPTPDGPGDQKPGGSSVESGTLGERSRSEPIEDALLPGAPAPKKSRRRVVPQPDEGDPERA